jgi:uncharacterized Fe-S cluster protein YjdI
MSQKEITKEYTNGELTVVWKPAKCIHAKVCVSTLPNVYDPNKKPWITPEDASNEALKNQIDRCPSGALSYYMNGEKKNENSKNSTIVTVAENGPLMVSGSFEVTDQKGNKEVKAKAAFCRCGASNNKPYCDGSHVAADFKG